MKLHEIAPLEPIQSPITQESWLGAIIWAWQHQLSVSVLLLKAANRSGTSNLSDEEWEALRQESKQFKPKLLTGTYWKMPVTAWVAQSFPRSSELLIRGKVDDARKMLMVEKNSALPRKPHRFGEMKKELDKTHRALPPAERRIKARELGGGTDWNKVK
jgi:hypothetical protein